MSILVRAPEQLAEVLQALPASMQLSVGVVDGRNIWRTDLDAAHSLVRRAVVALGTDRVLVAPSCSLLHVPVDLEAPSNVAGRKSGSTRKRSKTGESLAKTAELELRVAVAEWK